MALRVRTTDTGGGDATLARRSGAVVLGLVVIGLALIALGGASLPAVIAGIAAILAAAFLAMRSS